MKTRFQLLFSPEGDAGAGGSSAPAGGAPAGSGTLLAGSEGQGAPQTPPAGQTPPNGQQTPVVTKSFREGWISNDGKIDKSAYERLPEHLKPFKDTLAKYDTDEALLTAFAHQSTLIGKKGLMPLPPGASEKDKAEFNARLREVLRVPEKPEGYGITKPKDVPDDQWNGDYVKGVTEIAHKHNISPEAMQELVKFDSEFAGKARATSEGSMQKQLDTEKSQLQQKWGNDFGANVALATRAARTAGLDPETDPIFRNARVVEAFAKFGAMVSDDKLVAGGTSAASAASDEAKAQDIISNKANPMNAAYHNERDPLHMQARQQVEQHFANAVRLKKKVA